MSRSIEYKKERLKFLLENELDSNISQESISHGSRRLLDWICHRCGYRWSAVVKERCKAFEDCPGCSPHKRLKYVVCNDCEKLYEFPYTKEIDDYFICKKCKLIRKGYKSFEENLEISYKKDSILFEKLKDYTKLSKEDFINITNHQKLFLKCPTCKDVWEDTKYNIKNRKNVCKNCYKENFKDKVTNKFRLKYPEISRYIKENQIIRKKSHKKIEWKCPECNYEWSSSIHTIFKRKYKYVCSKCYIKPTKGLRSGIKPIIETHPELASELVDKSLENKISYGSGKYVEWCCKKCSHIWSMCPNARSKGHGCPECAKINKESKYELFINDFLINNFPNLEFRRNDQETIISDLRKDSQYPLELDFYIPSIQLAIEHQGQHHFRAICNHYVELEKIQKKDLEKKEICSQLGIKLLETTYKQSYKTIGKFLKKEINNRIKEFKEG